MTRSIVFLALFISACAQLMHGQEQPVVTINGKEKIYYTTCGGSVEDWGSCNRKAQSTCASSYSVIKKFESAVGGRRELTFQCK